MTFEEWTETYGIESARSQFGLSSHMVFVVKPKKYVLARCGQWVASEPLARGEYLEVALERLRAAVNHCFATEEIIVDETDRVISCGV